MAKKIEIDPNAFSRQTKYDGPWALLAKEFKLLGKQADRIQQFRLVFTLDKLGFPSLADVQAGKIVGYKKQEFTFLHYEAGIRELKSILQDSVFMSTLIKRIYDQTILPVLKKRVGKRSLERHGSGAAFFKQSSIEETGKTRKARELKFFTRSADELGEKWKRVYDLITSPAKMINSTMAQGFTLQDLLKQQMESENSTFTSVYMMAEFGTGQVANKPRRFISKTVTPYKVSPALAKFGGNTSWWFSVKEARLRARAIEKARGKIVKSSKSKKEKLASINSLNTRHLFDFAMGAKGPRSIEPRNVIFDSRGMVIQLQAAYEKAYKILAEELNGQIAIKVPSWPPNLITLPFNPFPIPKNPKIVG